MEIVGQRRGPQTPEECLRRGIRLIKEAEALVPPRPRRSFVFKARTWEDYEAWKRAQDDPRYW